MARVTPLEIDVPDDIHEMELDGGSIVSELPNIASRLPTTREEGRHQTLPAVGLSNHNHQVETRLARLEEHMLENRINVTRALSMLEKITTKLGCSSAASTAASTPNEEQPAVQPVVQLSAAPRTGGGVRHRALTAFSAETKEAGPPSMLPRSQSLSRRSSASYVAEVFNAKEQLKVAGKKHPEHAKSLFKGTPKWKETSLPVSSTHTPPAPVPTTPGGSTLYATPEGLPTETANVGAAMSSTRAEPAQKNAHRASLIKVEDAAATLGLLKTSKALLARHPWMLDPAGSKRLRSVK